MKERTRGLFNNEKFNFEGMREISNKERNDCLHVASEKGYSNIIEILMSNNHDATKVNKQKMNALHVAVNERTNACCP